VEAANYAVERNKVGLAPHRVWLAYVMLKLKYLRHPLRTANTAKDLVAARLEMRRIAAQGERRFREDPHYNLAAVTDGFVSRLDYKSDDTALLKRICAAYIKTVEQQKFSPRTYEATTWWEEMRQRSLRPVMHALRSYDINALRAMYRNFFRDPCSTGLIAVPYGMTSAYFGKTIKDVHRRFYLSDVLHRVEYWRAQTAGSFTMRALAGPGIGNPFGAVIEETLVNAGAPPQHYWAHKISSLLESGTVAVAEIGGGFGGMAYYLLRDRGGVRYVNFDVPESIALTSYYLAKSFPQLTFLLYGEQDPTEKAIARADVVLLPLFELARMPAGIVDLSFSSHSMSDISSEALADYLANIARMTRKSFLYVGIDRDGEPTSELISRRHPSFKLTEIRSSGWHSHKAANAREVECVYHFGNLRDRAQGVGICRSSSKVVK
jgi:hypothetical protein